MVLDEHRGVPTALGYRKIIGDFEESGFSAVMRCKPDWK